MPDLATLLASVPPEDMTPRELAIIAKLGAIKKADSIFSAGLRADLFPEQQAALDDEARQQALLCPRRSGKTFVLVKKQIKAARRHPHADASVYVDTTQKLAYERVWEPLKTCLSAMGIKYKANETRLTITAPGLCPLWLRGADQKDEIDKFRGFKLATAILDECASYGPHFEKMIDESIGPALEDYDAQLCLAGTPGAALIGKFWKVTRPVAPAPGWSVHRWSILQNVRFPRWWSPSQGLDPRWREIQQEMLGNIRLRNAWDEMTPAYRREWLGEWVQDDQGLVYRYDQTRNGWDGVLPSGQQWEHVMGVDLGHDDKFAIVVWAYCPRLPDLWCVYQYHKPGLDVTDCAERMSQAIGIYHPHSVMIDQGGLGKMVAEEIRRRHQISCEPAVKTEKAAHIKFMNTDWGRGLLHVQADSEYASQASVLQWAPGKAGLVEDPGYQNDLCDAGLYGWRKAYAYTYRPEKPRPKPGSPEAAEEEAARMEAEVEAQMKGRRY